MRLSISENDYLRDMRIEDLLLRLARDFESGGKINPVLTSSVSEKLDKLEDGLDKQNLKQVYDTILEADRLRDELRTAGRYYGPGCNMKEYHNSIAKVRAYLSMAEQRAA